jgi:hypothetical protein
MRVVVGRVGGDKRSQDAMTGNRKRLGEKIRDVVQAADENDTKVSLADPVPDPMQAHVGGSVCSETKTNRVKIHEMRRETGQTSTEKKQIGLTQIGRNRE